MISSATKRNIAQHNSYVSGKSSGEHNQRAEESKPSAARGDLQLRDNDTLEPQTAFDPRWMWCCSVLQVSTVSFWQSRDESTAPQGKKRKNTFEMPLKAEPAWMYHILHSQLGQSKSNVTLK